MDTKQAFSEAMKIVEKAKVAAMFRRGLLAELEFFRRLPDLEPLARISDFEFQSRWQKLLQVAERLKVLDLFRKDQELWKSLEDFYLENSEWQAKRQLEAGDGPSESFMGKLRAMF